MKPKQKITKTTVCGGGWRNMMNCVCVKNYAIRTMVCPRSVEVQDLQHNVHNLQVQVLGTEETWNTPSLLLATNASTGGKAVFSQVIRSDDLLILKITLLWDFGFHVTP